MTDALKNAIAKLAGNDIEATMVNLIVGCLVRRLRQLTELLGLCFEVRVDGKDVTRQKEASQSQNPVPFGFVFGGPLDFNLEEWQAKR